MRKFFTRIAVISGVIGTLVSCQKDASLEESQKDKFIKFYGTSATGVAMKQTNDGGYVMLGTTQGASSTDIYLVRTDEYGNHLWSRTYNGSSIPVNDLAHDLTIDDEGNYAIIGTTETEINSMFFLLISPGGSVIHRNTYNTDSTGQHEQGLGILSLSNKRFLICGEILQAEGGFLGGIVREINGNNNYSYTTSIVDRREYNTEGELLPDQSYNLSFAGLSDFKALSRIAIIGTTDFTGAANKSDNILALTFTLGENIANTGGELTNSSGDDAGLGILSDGVNLVVSGYQSVGGIRKLFVRKYDHTDPEVPSTQWIHISTGSNEISGARVIDANDGYVICGSKSVTGYSRQIYLAKIGKADGSILWEQDFGYTELDEAKDVVVTTDGGLAVFGTSSDERGNTVMCMIKTDANGNVK